MVRAPTIILCALVISGWQLVSTCGAYPLTEQQEARLKQFIPRTFDKLSRREPVHIVALGDSVSTFYRPGAQSQDILYSYFGRLAQRLEQEFFYTGGVRAAPPLSGAPEKHHDYLGPEITIQCLARSGNVSLHALQRLTSDAFLYKPDLVLLNFGINDALTDYSLESFRTAIEQAVTICQERGVEVIVMGCTEIIEAQGPTGLGLTRPFATTAREVAEEKGVLFVDLGKATIAGPGTLSGQEPRTAIEAAASLVKRHFQHGPGIDDHVHPDRKAHQQLGDYLFEALLNGAAPEDYSVSGTCQQAKDGSLEVEFELKNETGQEKEGYLCMLDSGHWLTSTKPYFDFKIGPGKSAKFKTSYSLRPSPEYEGKLAYERLEGSEVYSRFPILLVDAEKTQVVDLRALQEPFAIVWKTGSQDEITSVFRVGCVVTNTADKPISGKFAVAFRDQKVTGDFELEPKQSKNVDFTFNLPDEEGRERFRNSLRAVFAVDDLQYVFKREIEASRALPLNQGVALARVDSYGSDKEQEEAMVAADRVMMHAKADREALYLSFDIPASIPLIEKDGQPAVFLRVAIDGRSHGLRRTFGFVDAIRVEATSQDGPGKTDKLNEATFGNGYDQVLDSEGIASRMVTLPEGGKRFSIAIPRNYFTLHEWWLENPNSLFGLDVQLDLPDLDPATKQPRLLPSRQFLLTGARMNRADARRLSVLELSENGTGRWSLRFY